MTKRAAAAGMAMCVICATGNARAADVTAPATSVESAETPVEQPNPRLKISYRRFSIAGLETTPIWLQGGQLDGYLVSCRWLRLGAEVEGGSGSASWAATSASLSYGLLGLTAGVQLPARVTPFLEGRFVTGVLSGELDGTLTVGRTSIAGASATTWLYGGGLEAGAEVYLHDRVYVSLALGWMHSSWHGIDVATVTQIPKGGVASKDLVGDSFTLKLGLGI